MTTGIIRDTTKGITTNTIAVLKNKMKPIQTMTLTKIPKRIFPKLWRIKFRNAPEKSRIEN